MVRRVRCTPSPLDVTDAGRGHSCASASLRNEIDLSATRIAPSVPVRRANIWAVPVPHDTVLAFSAVGTPITSGTELIELLNVTPDGRWLVYDSNLHGNADIFRLPINGRRAERLTDDPRPEYGGVLSPDGRELVWQRYVNGRRRLFSRRLDSDSAREIGFGGGDQGVPHWSPDGRSLVAWSHDTEEGAVFVMHRDARGVWQPAWSVQGGRLPGWSPDGRAIAFIAPDGGIATIPADSGVKRVVLSSSAGQRRSDCQPAGVERSFDDLVHRKRPARAQRHLVSCGARRRCAFRSSTSTIHRDVRTAQGFTTDGKRFYIALDERFSNVRRAELVR